MTVQLHTSTYTVFTRTRTIVRPTHSCHGGSGTHLTAKLQNIGMLTSCLQAYTKCHPQQDNPHTAHIKSIVNTQFAENTKGCAMP